MVNMKGYVCVYMCVCVRERVGGGVCIDFMVKYWHFDKKSLDFTVE